MRGALARLILNYHVMSDNVRSNRGAWSRQPCAGNLATGVVHGHQQVGVLEEQSPGHGAILSGDGRFT